MRDAGGTGAGGAGAGGRAPAGTRVDAVVERVIDGDTIVLEGGARVRLVQVDTPEVGARAGCHGREASRLLRRMLPAGTAVEVAADPALDDVDQHGRLLRWVYRDGRLVQQELVRQGAAGAWFFRGARGRHADALLAALAEARAAQRGLWGACPGTAVDVTAPVATGPAWQ